MQVASRDVVYDFRSAQNRPAITVSSGEVFEVQTQLCSGTWLKSLEDQYAIEKRDGNNPCVVVAVRDAHPGQMLRVDILDIRPEEIGYTGFRGDLNDTANRIWQRDWGLTARTVAIRDGFVHFSQRLKLPIAPMIGTIATAHAQIVCNNGGGDGNGGNLDAQEIAVGASVYLPVSVEGALLHVGDVHALQGDGEINSSGGIECRATVRLRVTVMARFPNMKWVRAENDTHLMTLCCWRTPEESFYQAAHELIAWMADGYGFTVSEAYLLLGQVLEARCTQFVNPMRTYICKIAKKYLT